jgi:hypothetical protein
MHKRRKTGFRWNDIPIEFTAVYHLRGEEPHRLLLLTTRYTQAVDLCLDLRKQGVPYAMVDPGVEALRVQVVIPIPQKPTATRLAVDRAIREGLKEPLAMLPPPGRTETVAEHLADAYFGDDPGLSEMLWH